MTPYLSMETHLSPFKKRGVNRGKVTQKVKGGWPSRGEVIPLSGDESYIHTVAKPPGGLGGELQFGETVVTISNRSPVKRILLGEQGGSGIRNSKEEKKSKQKK